MKANSIILAIVLFGAPAVPERRLPLNEGIIRFCQDNIGKVVGQGECGNLARMAAERAGARAWYNIGQSPSRGDYVWGRLLCVVGDGGKPKPSPDIRPGDIIQFRDADFAGTITVHHTAVIASVSEDGMDIDVLHQGAGRPVYLYTYHLADLKSGWLRIYRPIPAGR